MPIGIFLFAQKFDFQKIEKNVKNEDSFALPLTSELDALCGENVHWFLGSSPRKAGSKRGRRLQNKKPTTRVGFRF